MSHTEVPHVKLNMNDLEKKLREDINSGEMSPAEEKDGLQTLPNQSPVKVNYDSNANSPIGMKAMAIDLSMIIKKRDLEQRGKPCYKVSPMKMKDKLAKLKVFSMPQKVGSDPVSTLNILAKKQN